MFSLFKLNLVFPGIRSRRRPCAILVEDSPTDSLLVRGAMEDEGFEVIHVPTAEEAIGVLHANGRRYPLVVADIGLTGMSGWDLCRKVRQKFPETCVVIITGSASSLEFMPEGCLVPVIVKSANMQPAFRDLHKLISK